MMRETTKTMAFIGTAVVVLVLAWFSRPAPATFDADSLVGDTLVEFDPLEARRLKIVSYNSVTGEPQEFEVAKVGDTWSIPSKDGYPADAEDQMAEAATALAGKEVLRVASESARDHRLYGVLDPTDEGRRVGEDGVGMRVTIENAAGNTLADLIIGKEDKDTTDQRYVRPAGRDVVLVAAVSTDKLTTAFSDWIEKDLLQLSPWDIQKVRINDYSFEAVPVLTQGGLRLSAEWDYRSDMTLVYDDSDAKWTAQSLLVWDPAAQEYVEKPLSDDQELSSQKLNDLKNALDDLRIVDVGKKPDGLSANLQASDDFLETSNEEALRSLIEHGFAPVSNEDGTLEIASTEGEVIVTMKTGVEYVLRFGEVQVDGDAAENGGADPTVGGNAAGSDLNRYLFVLARFNEDAIPKPEIQDPPALPPGLTAEEASADAAADTGEATSEEADEGSEASSDAETAEDAAEAATDSEGDESAADAEGEQSETEKLLAERKRIEEENQRKLDEYADKITKGKETVQELNRRFGDWYYVIDDAEYQKIHLSREQVVQEKQAEAAAATGAGQPGAIDAGGFGAPGQTIPGLPDVPGLLDETAEPPTTDPADAGEAEATGATDTAEQPEQPAADAAETAAPDEAESNN